MCFFDEIETKLQEVLETMQKDMLERAKAHLENIHYDATNWEEFKDSLKTNGFVKAMWCGETECEDKIKEEVQATQDVCHLSRNI